MVPRKVKALYYALLSPLMRVNAARHRMIPTTLKKSRRAHLGPGQRNYLAGWTNVDANLVSSNPDIWADMRFKLPFPKASLDAIYSHHMIEHLPNLDFHFQDMFRCLRPGGVIRVGGPHGDNAMIAMQSGRKQWFGDWPTNRTSMGGRFENFIFCKGEHLTILTASFLEELCRDAGFTDIAIVSPKATVYPQMFGQPIFDIEPVADADLPHTILVEARKP
jgi:predicted SAM-dependent methyltransferase